MVMMVMMMMMMMMMLILMTMTTIVKKLVVIKSQTSLGTSASSLMPPPVSAVPRAFRRFPLRCALKATCRVEGTYPEVLAGLLLAKLKRCEAKQHKSLPKAFLEGCLCLGSGCSASFCKHQIKCRFLKAQCKQSPSGLLTAATTPDS